MGTPTLVGRAGPMAVLRSAVDVVASGRGRCVLLDGHPGVGKSRLLGEAADYAAERGYSVHQGRANELTRVVPLAVLLEALGGVATGPVLPADGREGYWRIDQLGTLIEERAREQPLLIALDDLHWADELTELALRVLVPAMQSSPVCWLMAHRPLSDSASSRTALHWLATHGAQRLPVVPLGDAAVAQLCADLLGAVPDRHVLQLATRAGGNPFLVGELLSSLREAGRIVATGTTATVTDDRLPTEFLSSVDYRLRDLSSPARSLLEAGAVIGRPFTLHEAAGLSTYSVLELVIAAKEAVHGGALVEQGAMFAFRHDLIREAVYDGLLLPIRQALHREAATVVRAEGLPLAEMASHLMRGALAGDAQAVDTLARAADDLTSTSPATAADLLMHSLTLLTPQDTHRGEITSTAVRLLASAGRVVEARELGEEALRAGLSAADDARLLLGMAEAHKHAGEADVVLELTRRALNRDRVPEGIRALLLASQAHALLQLGDIVAASEVGGRAVTIGHSVGEVAATVYGAGACAAGAHALGELGAALEMAGEAVRAADKSGGESGKWHPRLWLAPVLVSADRLVEAEAVYEIGQREADRLGTAWSLPLWHYYRGELRSVAGRLDDAAAEFETGLDLAERLGALAMAPSLHLALSRTDIRRARLIVAADHLGRARQLRDAGIGVVRDDMMWTSMLLQEAQGRSVDAGMLDALVAVLPRQPLLLAYRPEAGPHLARIALRAGRTDLAEQVADVVATLGRNNPSANTMVAIGPHTQGLLHADTERLDEAVQLYRIGPRPLAFAAALEDAAAATPAAAPESLRRALEVYTVCAAKHDAERVRARMRDSGTRRTRTSRRTAGSSGLSSLTRSELRVVKLVAEGLTNRKIAEALFLSPHTVDTHIRHAFAKLDVSGRVELTRKVLLHDS